MVNSNQKGKRGEREARDVLNSVFGTHCRRGQQHKGGPDSPDIAEFIPHVHIEVKNVEHLRLRAAVEQAEADSGTDSGDIPVVMWKKPRSKQWYWIVPVEQISALGLLIRRHFTLRQHQAVSERMARLETQIIEQEMDVDHTGGSSDECE